jgi:hypothetical protein
MGSLPAHPDVPEGGAVVKPRAVLTVIAAVAVLLAGQQWLTLNGLEIPLHRTGVGEAVRVRLSRVPRLVAELTRPQAHFIRRGIEIPRSPRARCILLASTPREQCT